MEKIWTKLLLSFLLCTYSTGIAFGNAVVLRQVLNSCITDYQLTSQGKARPIPGSPVWTIKSHILVHQTLDVPAETGPYSESLTAVPVFGIYRFTGFVSKYSYLEYLPSKPRDPPRS